MEATLTLRNAAWLLIALGMAVAPHVPRLPLWISLLAAAMALWRLAAARRGMPLPRRWLLVSLALAGAVGTFLSYGTVFGRTGGVALFILLISLKLMEMRNRRDAVVVAFLGYFLIITNFLYDQSIPTAGYMLVTVVTLTATLVGLHHATRPATLRQQLRTAGLLLAQALPIMVVLFIFFPRIPSPMWGVPQDTAAGVSGLSDTMTPGSISELSLSDAVAFRVDFIRPPPPRSKMYWRGPVLWHFDGQTWSAGASKRFRKPNLVAEGEPVEYTVTLEAHNKHWLFALDLPLQRPERSALSFDYQLFSNQPVRTRLRYAMRSQLDYRVDLEESRPFLNLGLNLPAEGNPRARALARKWRSEAATPGDVVGKALSYFRNEPFFYTLRPPLLGPDPVDDFLFNTRRGFCEHFSSSFAFLMRAAGIPTRIVTGYQGGEINPIGNYLIVRQADAHAWAEVWLEGWGWMRVDPTAAVAPNRLEQGIGSSLPAGDPLPVLARPEFGWLKRARLTWDAAANAWNQWVLGYTQQRQLEFLSRVGMNAPSWQGMAVALFVGSGGMLLGFAALMLWRLRPRQQDAVQREWLRFCRRLEKRGITRRPSEGPRDFAQRVARSRPQLSARVTAIAQLYIDLRYGTDGNPAAVKTLRGLVAAFRA